jgi:hypothetical protein
LQHKIKNRLKRFLLRNWVVSQWTSINTETYRLKANLNILMAIINLIRVDKAKPCVLVQHSMPF